jgi:NADH:ubiquinone reductase (H+-translocating)
VVRQIPRASMDGLDNSSVYCGHHHLKCLFRRGTRAARLDTQRRGRIPDGLRPGYPPDLSAKAKAELEQLGVIVRTKAMVTEVLPKGIVFRSGEQTETIQSRTMLWAAGVKASPLGKALAEAAGIETDREGRGPVESDLSVQSHPEVFVIGDLAHFSHPSDSPPLPGLAPVAMQEGQYVAKLIGRRLKDGTLPPFHYRDYGTMATIGRARGVAMIGRLKLSGLRHQPRRVKNR